MLRKHNEIWIKSVIRSKKSLIGNLSTKKYLKTKIKCYKGKINEHFQGDKIPKKVLKAFAFWLILVKAGKNYYPPFFLEESIYVVKEKKIPKYIISDIKISSDDYDKEDSYNEDSDEENSN